MADKRSPEEIIEILRVHLPKELVDLLDSFRNNTGMTRNEVIRLAVKEALRRYDSVDASPEHMPIRYMEFDSIPFVLTANGTLYQLLGGARIQVTDPHYSNEVLYKAQQIGKEEAEKLAEYWSRMGEQAAE